MSQVIDNFVVAIAALSILMNIVNLVTLANRNCKQTFRQSMCYMVACLSIADLLTSVNSLLWGIRIWTEWYPIFYLFTLYWATVQVSFFTVLIMAVDRFIAVSYPTGSENIVSPLRTLVTCFLVWVISLSVAILIYHKLNEGKLLFCVLFEVEIIVVVVIYFVIYRKVRAMAKLAHSGESDEKEKKRKLISETRLCNVVFVLCAILIVTVLPYVLGLHIELASALRSPGSKPDKHLGKFLDYYLPIELLNFLVNPIVYAWRLPKYRKALLKTFSLKR